MIIDETAVHKYRISRRLNGILFCSVAMGIYEVVTTDLPLAEPLFWVAVAIGMFAVVAKKEIGRLSPAQAKLFRKWRRLTGQPVRRFPVHSAQRQNIAFWAEHDLLRPLALRATKAFNLREITEQNEIIPARRRLYQTEKGADDCGSEDFLSHLKEVGQAKRAVSDAEAQYVIVSKVAERAQARYHAMWDFLVGPEPEGISVLRGPNFQNPNTYRLHVYRQALPTVVVVPPDAAL